VNFGLQGDATTLAALGADVDLLLLEETTPAWEHTARATLGRDLPFQHWLHGPAAGGVAVLSRRPLQVEELENPSGWFPALRVVAQTPLGPVQALVVHLHPPVTEDGSWMRGYLGTGEVRRNEVATFAQHLEAGLPTLVAGDFNEGTSGPAVRLLEEGGLRTVLPEFAPRATTWRWAEGSVNLTAQFDHITYDAALEPLDARVVQRGQSDHLPVVATFVRAHPKAVRPTAPSGTSLAITLGR
jgi:endonuclease/exonuclease/phosphatase family metal-dependent hydrolase